MVPTYKHPWFVFCRGPARGGGGGGSHVVCQNFKISLVGVYKCFMSLSEIEQNFFVFVGILEKGIEIRCKENITILQFFS